MKRKFISEIIPERLLKCINVVTLYFITHFQRLTHKKLIMSISHSWKQYFQLSWNWMSTIHESFRLFKMKWYHTTYMLNVCTVLGCISLLFGIYQNTSFVKDLLLKEIRKCILLFSIYLFIVQRRSWKPQSI